MEQKIDYLLGVAQNLGSQSVVNQLASIKQRSLQPDADLIIPLVGEFSSGKTTLINALTDSKQLETATKPTTATIYEIHFGCEKCEANVLTAEGQCVPVAEISDLKNDKLADAKIVTVFDTSKIVPSSTVLVDTPGLSSPNPEHRQTLVDFLPQADAILLVSDVNQQVTKTLTDFVGTIKLSKRPIYMVLTKCEGKSDGEIEAAKKYIKDNCEIPVQQIIATSAVKGNIKELCTLLDNIRKSKKDIIQQVDEQRLKDIAKLMVVRIDEMMAASTSDDGLDFEIRKQQLDLDKIKRNINRLVDSMASDISECERNISRRFEDTTYAKLSALVSGKSANLNNEAFSVINNTASLLMSDYKSSIQSVVGHKIQESQGTENEIPLESLSMLDLSNYQILGLSYDMDLDSMGHEYDKAIRNGLVLAAAAAAAVATAGLAAPAGAAGAGTAATTGATAAGSATATGTAVVTTSTVINAADTVTDIGSMYYNRKMMKRIDDAKKFAGKTSEQYGKINKADNKKGGLVTSIVGFATDKLLSKPQRAKAVRDYVDNTLASEFKIQLSEISQKIVNAIRDGLQNAAAAMIEEKTNALNQLKQQRAEQKEAFAQRLEMFRDYKSKLQNI